jgi:hypothetical protein
METRTPSAHAYAPGEVVAHVSDPTTSFGIVEFGDTWGANVVEHDGDTAWFEHEDIVLLTSNPGCSCGMADLGAPGHDPFPAR